MTLLCTTFSLLALLAYTAGRLRQIERGSGGWPLILSAGLVAAPLAVLSKESGVVIVAYLWCLEWFALRNRQGSVQDAAGRWLRLALSLAGVLALVYLVRFWSVNETGIVAYRGFTLTQRLLTEGQILWWYLGQIVWPRTDEMGLVHDYWKVARGFWQPWQASVSWLAWGGVVASALLLQRRFPLWGFGALWFLLGHALEAGPVPLELVYEHRNYLPAVGPVVLIVVGLARGVEGRRQPLPALWVLIVLVAISVLHARTAQRADEWSSALRWTQRNAAHHPNSFFAMNALGDLYTRMIDSTPDGKRKNMLGQLAGQAYQDAMKLKPREIGPILSYIGLRNRGRLFKNDDLYDRAEKMLARPSLSVSSFNALMGAASCAANRTCIIPEPRLRALVETALRNPGCDAIRRSKLLTVVGQYYGQVQRDPARAIHYLQQAATVADGDPLSQLLLAYWLNETGDRAQATQWLDTLSKRDDGRQFEARVVELRTEIAAGRTSADDPGAPASEMPAGPAGSVSGAHIIKPESDASR